MDDIKIFETTNVDLSAYLMMEGIKLLECQVKDRNRGIIVMRFLDDAQNCLDLERVFISSESKKLMDTKRYLLNKIYETKREES